MNQTTLFDTLDVASGFSRPNFTEKAKALLPGGVDSATLAAVAQGLEAAHPQTLVEAIAYLNSLDVVERHGLLNEYCRQRFLREAQREMGYGEADAGKFLAWAREAGVGGI